MQPVCAEILNSHAMSQHTIDPELCKKCRLCMEVCPCGIIGMNGEVSFIHEREAVCLGCGQCMAICSSGAISINGLSYEHDFTKLPRHPMKYEDFINLLSSRRSIRNYKNKRVSDHTIDQILETVCYAPFGASPDKMNITVVIERERIEMALPHISGFLDNMIKRVENPVASLILRKKKGQEVYRTIRDHLYPKVRLGNYRMEHGDRITRNAPALIIFHAEKSAAEHTSNSLIYATYVMLGCVSIGLGASMNGIVSAAINKVKKVREIFEIPHDHEAVMALTVGYSKYQYRRAIRRQDHSIHKVT